MAEPVLPETSLIIDAPGRCQAVRRTQGRHGRPFPRPFLKFLKLLGGKTAKVLGQGPRT